MEKSTNGNSYYKHHVTRSTHSLQSKNRSTAPSNLIQEANKHAPKSRLSLLNRSKSKACKADQESDLTSRTDRKKLHQGSRDDSAKFLQRSQSKMEVPRRTRSANTSPSAWALSPGRSLHSVPMPLPFPEQKSKVDSCSTKGSSGVSGVLKYFSKKKKMSHLQEEEYHQFRIMHNRLLQWRFANARADVSMPVLKIIAQKKLFNVWLRMSIMRNIIVEKRTQIQKFDQEIKLYKIISSQCDLLKEWTIMEGRNSEAIGRLTRKLSAISVCFPLAQGAKADVTSFLDAMSMATKVMENIEAMITNIQAQAEHTCYMLTELSVIVKEQIDHISMLEKSVANVVPLEAQETSLRLHYIQMKSREQPVLPTKQIVSMPIQAT